MSRSRTLADLASQSLATDSEVSSAVSNKISGNGSITSVVEVTQAQYNALTPNATTLYVIVG